MFADRVRGGFGDPGVVVGQQFDQHRTSPPARAAARPRPRGAGPAGRRRARPGARSARSRRGAVRTSAASATARTRALGSSLHAQRVRASRARPRPRRRGRSHPRPRRYRRADRARSELGVVSGDSLQRAGRIADPVLTDRSDVGPGGTDAGRSSHHCSPGSVSRTGRHRPCRYALEMWRGLVFVLSHPGWTRTSSARRRPCPQERGAERGDRHEDEDLGERVRPTRGRHQWSGADGRRVLERGSAWQSVGRWTRRSSLISRCVVIASVGARRPELKEWTSKQRRPRSAPTRISMPRRRRRTRPAPDFVARGRRIGLAVLLLAVAIAGFVIHVPYTTISPGDAVSLRAASTSTARTRFPTTAATSDCCSFANATT